jgi:magnesium-protoporphyrin IX monomethyl ester (oxidative) cyclase
MSLDKRTINRVLLVFPPVVNDRFTNNICEIPLGIASLAAYIKDKVEVRCLDCALEGYRHIEKAGGSLIRFGLAEREIIRRIAEAKPDLVGFSCLFSSQFPAIRSLAEKVKRLDAGIITVAGGTHPSFRARSCLESTQLDYIVRGEGELGFSRLIDALKSGGDVSKIPGLAFRADGQVRVNENPEYLDDLATLPFPARELFKVEEYFKINVPMQLLSHSPRNLAVATSRGCPFRCAFCSSTVHWGNCQRARPAESVLRELEQLKEKYRVEEIKFEDDNLTSDKERARQLFQGMIDRKLDLMWNTPNGISVWSLDPGMLELMKQSGCYEITVAVESGDPWVLKELINKPVNLEKTREMVRVIKELGIGTNGYFIIGFPGETRAQIMNTLNYARSLDLDRCYIFIYTPLPGTPLAQLAFDRGLLPQDHDFENANNYFRPRLRLSEVESGELLKIHRRAFWRINLAPMYRHPVRFVEKYYRTLVAHPEYALKFFRALWQ